MTAKAKIDKHPLYGSIRKGRGIQTFLAKKLHHDAGVSEGTCGIEEIEQFQDYLKDY